MKYYLDCEFDGLGGPLLSMALVSETGKSMYVTTQAGCEDAWVAENVLPVMYKFDHDKVSGPLGYCVSEREISELLEVFFKGDAYPHVVADWPDDIKYFAAALITGPGTMIDVPGMKFSVVRVDAYPTNLPGAIQHNAWWDAMALRYRLIEGIA